MGKRITYHNTSAWITETEAYVGAKDQAAHGYKNHKAKWNRALFMAPGTIYVFTMYGSNLLNFITQPVGNPQGVLIRGVQPASGIQLMQRRRHQTGINLTNGPGKLCTAMDIDLIRTNRRSAQRKMDDRPTPLLRHG
ncbi:MAG: DNA-3-methyladenine glycosylase [Acetilactobacillus jinshanensis]